ncbi:hypothetical protein F5884DRAFT_875405 [Xylogone sp. PMI_703]|nr:hypothetical protein F5884DRAFT_875405 [Xylogone sp. PMI_703]
MLPTLLPMLLLAFSNASPTSISSVTSSCPPVEGTFNVTNFQLYPENVDWDSIHCKFYIGSNFNGSVLVYDPYTQEQSVISFPGITGVVPYHVSGVDFDFRTGYIYFQGNSRTPYVTGGQNLSGPNTLIKYDTSTQKVVFIADLAPFQAQVQNQTGVFTSRFQDMAEDIEGNSYTIASYGNSIAKVSHSGEVSIFYAPGTNSSVYGFGGISSWGHVFVLVDNASQSIRRFTVPPTSMNIEEVNVPNLPTNVTFDFDEAYLPPKYNGRVLLAADDNIGIRVFYSVDSWISATYLGVVPNTIAGGVSTAVVQISESIYISNEYFSDTGVFQVPGNRTEFPFIDITTAVESLLDGI